MASLNTLRTRGGVIVSIVIGLALFAFLFGEYAPTGNNSAGSGQLEIGEINGATIEYPEYSSTENTFSNIVKVMSNKNTLSSQEQIQAQDMAWESLILKHSYQPGFDALGIALGDYEIVDMVSGAYVSPVVSSYFIDRETGLFNPMLIKSTLSRVGIDQRATITWGYLKQEMYNQRQMSKYINLITKGSFITDLEVANNVTTANSSYSANYISQNYSTIADSTVNISSSDIKSYYSKHENTFKQEEARDVEYVVFDLLPSTTDYEDAVVYINEIADEFKASDNPMRYATLNSTVDNKFYKRSELEDSIAINVFNNPDAMYGPILKGDKYTISRLSAMKNTPDTIGAKHILLANTDQKVADSIVALLKNGADFKALSDQFSTDAAAKRNGGDLGLFAPEQMIPEFSDACIAEKIGNAFSLTTDFGIHVIEVTKKTKPVTKAQIATITYNIEPSAETQQLVYGEASKFIASGSDSYDSFKTTATESALSKRVARIRNTDREMSGLNQARELIRWAFNQEEGAVSHIMEIDGDYVIAALTDVSEVGTKPIEEVIPSIRALLLIEKKAQILRDKMANASSLDAVASTIGAEVKELKDLKFNSFYIDSIGVEPKLIGAICGGAAKNTVSKPVDGANGVYLFNVNNVTIADDVTMKSERVLLEATSQNYLMERVTMALIESSKMVDMRIKFY